MLWDVACCGTQLAAVRAERSEEWFSGWRETLWRQEIVLIEISSLSKGKFP